MSLYYFMFPIWALAVFLSFGACGDVALVSPSNFFLDEKQESEALARLEKYTQQNLWHVSTNKTEYSRLRYDIEDLRRQLEPTYLCKLACMPNKQVVTVIFESPVFDKANNGNWAITVFPPPMNGRRYNYHQRMFKTFDDDLVANCAATNFFQLNYPDTLIVRSVMRRSPTSFSLPVATFFALSHDEQAIVVRIERNGVVYYPDINVISEDETDLFMEAVLQHPFLFTEYELEQCFQNDTTPEILNRFIYLNSKFLGNGQNELLKELRKSIRLQRAVESLMQQKHPWIREAANYYLIHFGDFRDG